MGRNPNAFGASSSQRDAVSPARSREWTERRMLRGVLLTFTVALGLAGCEAVRYEPAKATRAYPFNLTQERVANIQVFNDGDAMLIVNPTLEGWTDFDLWLNQRYMHHVDQLAPGQTLRIPLADFWDVRGEGPFPGGLLRYYQPTPIRLVQIQTSPSQPLIGFRAIPTERELEATEIDKNG